MVEVYSFYDKVIARLLIKNVVGVNDAILVTAAGALDKETFHKNGFHNVLITNIDKDKGVLDYTPYKWEYQDLENLTYPDDAFDWVFVHAGLHHCSSPHRGLCEMLRVAKKGIGVFEARDSILNKLATSIGLVPKYELEPCVLSDGKNGGLRNTDVPNFIYRWTEIEAIKIVNSYLPQYKHKFYFYYGFRIPVQRLAMSPSMSKRIIGRIANLISPVIKLILPKQGNHFAFIATKTGEIHPWLEYLDGNFHFKTSYIKNRFNPEKYKV
jgi:SAM-dependent methyltransferase